MSPQALPVATVAPQGLSFGIPGGPEPGGAAGILGAITSCWEIRTGSEHLLRPTTFPGEIFPAGMSCFNRKRDRWVAAAAPPQMLKVWLIFSSCGQRWLGLCIPGKHKLLTFGHLMCFGRAWCPPYLPIQAAQQFHNSLLLFVERRSLTACRAHSGLCCQGFHRGLKWHKGHKILVIATCWAGILLCITRGLS